MASLRQITSKYDDSRIERENEPRQIRTYDLSSPRYFGIFSYITKEYYCKFTAPVREIVHFFSQLGNYAFEKNTIVILSRTSIPRYVFRSGEFFRIFTVSRRRSELILPYKS